MKKAGIAMAALLFVLPLAGCTKDSESDAGLESKVGTVYADQKVGFQLESPAEGEEIAIMHTTKGDIKIRFFPEAAPKAVENFTTHAKNGYYDGLTFHRVMNDFMIQGGDPEGTGGGGKSIWGKDFEDEFDQKLLNLRGSLAMANRNVNTNGSQFFINQAPASAFQGKAAFEYDPKELEQKAKDTYQSYLQQYGETVLKQNGLNSWKDMYEQMKPPTIADRVPDEVWDLYGKTGGNLSLDGAWRATGGHTVFGQVFEGMDIVDTIAAVKTKGGSGNDKDMPVENVLINSIDIVKYSK